MTTLTDSGSPSNSYDGDGDCELQGGDHLIHLPMGTEAASRSPLIHSRQRFSQIRRKSGRKHEDVTEMNSTKRTCYRIRSLNNRQVTS